MERKELFSRIKLSSYYLGIKFDAKKYFSLSNSELKHEAFRLEDEVEDLEECQDFRAYKAL